MSRPLALTLALLLGLTLCGSAWADPGAVSGVTLCAGGGDGSCGDMPIPVDPPGTIGGTDPLPSDPTLTYPNSDMVFSLWTTDIADLGINAPSDSITSSSVTSATTTDLSYITASLPGPDVNVDGSPDWLLGVNSTALDGAGVQVLLNDAQGSGIVVYSATYPTGAVLGDGPSAIAAADVDGDGTLDIVAANGPDGSVSVLRNDGSGVFGAAQIYPAGTVADLLAVDDLNGDGYPDIVALDEQAGLVSVLLNDGDGSFSTGGTFGVGPGMTSVTLTDLDDDGDLDLMAVDTANGGVAVLLNNGDGTFAPKSEYPAGIGPSSIVSPLDVNGDGYLDVVILNGQDETVLLNNGAGTFAAETPLTSGDFGVSIGSVCTADIFGGQDCQAFTESMTDSSGPVVPVIEMNGPTGVKTPAPRGVPVVRNKSVPAGGGGALDGLSLVLLGGLIAVRRRKR